MTILGAIAFQAVNPKAWLMAVNVVAVYASSSSIFALFIAFMLLNLPCILLWAVLGDRLGYFLQQPAKLRLFNALMASSLCITAIWMLSEIK
ncbi:MAG: hypothetical protein XXXJIFNMEKO3_03433 [Candidatus Erwinia impunctatus]|nr:hypothetical protein XXXJIFNMEKO_03433 [Culicoides impunctatus]